MPLREGGQAEMVWSYPKYRTLTELQQVFEDTAMFTGRPFSVSGDGDPERVPGETITDQYLSVLGVRPFLGRALHAGRGASGRRRRRSSCIGHGLWTRRYGADPGVLGRVVHVGGVAHTVVGVLPHGFRGTQRRCRDVDTTGGHRSRKPDRSTQPQLFGRRAAEA